MAAFGVGAGDAHDQRRCPGRLILENSGVAEPRNILQHFADAERDGHPLCARIWLDSLVTVVDAHSFSKDWVARMPVISRPDLGEGGALRPVVDLLVEQIEYAPRQAHKAHTDAQHT